MNNVSLIGRLTRDPERRHTPDGTSVCDMRIAVDTRKKDAPMFIDVVAFAGQADSCAQFLEKGREVAVSGRLQYEQWEAKDGGGKRSKHSVVANQVDFLRGSQNAPAQESTPDEEPSPVAAGMGAADDDIPF